MKRKLFSRVVAVILAVIMIGSVFAVAFQAFAAGPGVVPIIYTGDTNTKNTVLIVAVVAFVVILAGAIVPTILKKRK